MESLSFLPNIGDMLGQKVKNLKFLDFTLGGSSFQVIQIVNFV